MSTWQPSMSSREQQPFGSADTGSSLNLALVAGVAMLALGAGLFSLGIFHGFQNGSCSSTGYTAHYGPVEHCGKGVGWWMLMLLGGIFVAGVGAALSRTSSTLALPVLFVAIGAPFIGLALRSSDAHLLIGRSASAGKLSVGIFGACFIIAGLVWGVFAARKTGSLFSGGSGLASLLAAVVGVALAFGIAAGVSSAIGPAAPPATQLGSPVGNQSSVSSAASSAAASRAGAAVGKVNALVKQATSEADKATKLAACVTAAGTNNSKIQACEAKFMP